MGKKRARKEIEEEKPVSEQAARRRARFEELARDRPRVTLLSDGPLPRDQIEADQLDLAVQVPLAGFDLDRGWLSVAWRATFDDIGNVDILACHIDACQEFLKKLPRCTDKGSPGLVFVEPGGFADKHHRGVFWSLSGHGPGTGAR